MLSKHFFKTSCGNMYKLKNKAITKCPAEIITLVSFLSYATNVTSRTKINRDKTVLNMDMIDGRLYKHRNSKNME